MCAPFSAIQDDDQVANHWRPLMASASKVRDELACQFIKHENLPNGSVIMPYVDMEKAWRVRNTGTRDWPPGTCLQQCRGPQCMTDTAFVPLLKVNEEGVIRAPIFPCFLSGYDQASFRLYHPDHGYFGQKLLFNFKVFKKSFVQVGV
ncbi:hypothetical protein BIW11_12620 [Tropilaelaps mercedesae]|uniref:Nbr1 FW domain-containing protein n=1 Tax=Tropilaelaps mercedesae TaxID=418985 RepID=A0A1V9X5V4_9ACAR|nr:hypothetical protein BIW11_12620 [Tropilaelaps mercedesae]